MWSFKRTLHVHRIIARSLLCSLSRSLTLGAQHSLAYNKTVRIYVLYICPRVMYERTREVNIGKSSRNLPHADRILVITLKSQPPPAPIEGSRMNQQHPVFYLAQEAIHYEASRQLDEHYLCICYNGNQGSILDCQLHHYISCVPNVSIQHSRWSYCQHLFCEHCMDISPESFNV